MDSKRTSKEAKAESRGRLADDLAVEDRTAAGIRGGFVLATLAGAAYRSQTAGTPTKTLEDNDRMQNFEIQN